MLVTAGPTYENIDPVRFIGNFSSGKMGFAIAEALANRGAEVHLVAGPVSLSVSHQRIKRTDVVSAKEMDQACREIFPQCDAAVFSAAVADYSPANLSAEKIKRTGDDLNLQLTPNPDIASNMGALKKAH